MSSGGRIAVVATFPPHVIPGFEHLRAEGHYATWLPQLAHSFSTASEYDIHWIVCHPRTQSLKPAIWLGQTFHFVAIPSRFSTLSGFWIDTLRIKTILDRLQPDLVHGWGSEGPSGYAAIRSHRKAILSVQGILSEYVASARMPLVLRARAFLERQMLRKSRWITVESSWGEEVIRKIAPQASISRIEYGVNPVFYDAVWTPQSSRPIAAFIGTTDHRKGIQAAVSAFCDPRLAKAELWVFGDDNSPLATKLRQISPTNVKWLGRKPAGELAQHLQKAWCLVLPTRADTSPNAVKECRVIGLPVITTRSGGQRDYIQDGKNGFIVEPDDASLLTERLHQVLGNLELATSLGAFDHQKQRAFFHPENTGQSFRKLYAQLLCGSGKPFERTTLKS